MADLGAAEVVKAYCQTHQLILTFVQRMSDDELYWRLSSGVHSIAFHVWHLARWADYFQASIPGMTPELSRRLGAGVEIWQSEALAKRWGFDSAQLGYAETGMYMSDEVALSLPMPARGELLNYTEKAFALADHAASMIDDEQFLSSEQPQPLTEGIWREGPVSNALMTHLTHENRHLGMMECLLGLQGRPGSASS